ncbi:MAG: ABC transporter ATP-binding protein [Acidimicrobiales bacterium]
MFGHPNSGNGANGYGPAGLGQGELCVRGLEKSFGPQAVLLGVDLDVPEGAISAVLGPSGSGKTTLLRVLAGFERPDSGSVRIAGRIVDDARHHEPVERRRIGYVSQEGSLFPHLDVRTNVGFGLSRRARGGRVDELLTMVGLESLGGRYPHQLSGGQQQRVAIARALAPDPRLVLLDEPFASLDAGLRTQVRGDVLAVLRRAGTTAVLVTHDQDEALSSADVVAVLRDGVIAQVDAPFHLYNHPVDPEVASFVGEANLLTGAARGSIVETALGPLALFGPARPDGAALTVLVRPEQLDLALDDAGGGRRGGPGGGPGGAKEPSAVVLSCDYHGHDTTVRVRVEPPRAGLPETLVARVAGSQSVGLLDRVRLRVTTPVEAWPAAAAHDPVPPPAPGAAGPAPGARPQVTVRRGLDA